LFSGANADDSKFVDAFKDLINNAWGRELGADLAKKLGVETGKAWTTEQTSGFLNGLQSYFH